jgi:4-hydroxythreonine-4-phosphate dehydrogenase
MKNRAIIATMIGDPAGIGPEVVVKAWVSGKAHHYSVPVLVGSAAAVSRALEFTGVQAKVRAITSLEQLSDTPDVIDVYDTGALDSADLPLGKDTVVGGRASAKWLAEADALARSGQVAGTVMAPISTGSLKLVNLLDAVVSPVPGKSYLVLVSGPLRVMHLTDHLALREVCDLITSELVFEALRTLSSSMSEWGMPNARIVVSGLNPHAAGKEDKEQIAPGVARARAAGINVVGPDSPDAVFRQCIEGRYDIVLAMTHDQGHIAIKTWGFSGNCCIILGPPYVHTSVGHGTAYDIAGKGIADASMILNAMCMAGSLASGQGFPPEMK